MSWSDPCSKCGEHRADCECGRDIKKEINVSKIKTFEDEFIPYEEALVLKELGFNEKCLGFFDKLKLIADCYCANRNSDWIEDNKRISAPLYQQAFRWFRDKHKLEGWVVPSYTENGREYSYIIDSIVGHEWEDDCNDYSTYEEAELACLRKLIEILKKVEDESKI